MKTRNLILSLLFSLICVMSYAQGEEEAQASEGNYWVDLAYWPFGPSGNLTNALWMMGGTPQGIMVDFRIGYDDIASLYLGKTMSTANEKLSFTPMLGAVYGSTAGLGFISHTTWRPWKLKLYLLNQFMTGDMNQGGELGWSPYYYHWGTYTAQFFDKIPVSIGASSQVYADFRVDDYNVEFGPSLAVDFPLDFYLNASYYFSIASSGATPQNTVFIGAGWMHEFPSRKKN